tara:strand:- start:3195 stop:3554 length:360 start_codon:yes stop_codon:yes gene_type:complete
MKKIMISLLLLAAVGCSTIDKGEDPIQVRSEQALGVAYISMDTFLTYADRSRGVMSMRETDLANKIQTWGKSWLRHSREALEDYQKTGDKTYMNMAMSYLMKIDDILLEIKAVEAGRVN